MLHEEKHIVGKIAFKTRYVS